MAHIPNTWIQSNQKILQFIIESKVLKGKNAFLSLEKVISELKTLQDETNLYSSQEIQTIFQEMEHYNIVKLKRSSGVSYIIPTEDYFTLKNLVEKNIATQQAQLKEESPIQTISATSTPLEQIYSDITNTDRSSAEFISELPKLIDLSVKILNDERTFWTDKSIISSCLGYLLLPRFEKDYLDELFLFSFALKHIYINSPYLVKNYWEHPEPVKKILDEYYLNSKIVLSDTERRNLLGFLGIPKLVKYPEQPADYRKTLGMIAYLMGEVYESVPNKKTLAYLEEKLVTLGDFDEVQRLIKVSKGELVPKSKEETIEDILTENEYDLLLEELDEDF